MQAALGFFAVLQILLAFVIGRGEKPLRPLTLLTRVLFVINGLVGILYVAHTLAGDAGRPIEKAKFLLDESTNFLLVLVGCLALYRPASKASRWPPWVVVGLAVVALVAVAEAIYVVAESAAALPTVPNLVLHHAPVYAGYSLLLVGFTRRFLAAEGVEEANRTGLLLLGWGIRPAQFATLSPLTDDSLGATEPAVQFAFPAFEVILLISWAAAQFLVTRKAVQDRRQGRADQRWVPGSLAAGALFGIVLAFLQNESDAYEAAQLVTLIVVRPILVSAAYERAATLRLALRMTAWAVSIVLVKAVFAASVGSPVLGLGPWDAAALPLGIMLGFAATRLTARFEHALFRGGATSTPSSSEERILSLLLSPPSPDGERGVTAAFLAESTGLAVPNVHRAIQRIRTTLLKMAPDGTKETELLERIVPLGGHGFRIRLTPLGQHYATLRLAELRGSSEPPKTPL